MPAQSPNDRSVQLALTDFHLKNFQGAHTARDVRDTIQRGLIARVLPSGIVQFTLRYRYQGKQRRFKLGDYSNVTLQEARKRARKAQSVIDNNGDPASERRAAKTVRTDTVAALVTDYLNDHARPNKRTAAEDERALNVEVLPHWRDRSVRSLTRADVKALVKPIVTRGSPIMANRVLALVRRLLNFAVDEEWIDANPAARVKKPAAETSRERVLTDDELQRLWRLLSRQPSTSERPAPGRKRAKGTAEDPICPVSSRLAALLKVRLLTAQRGGEVVNMRWADLDLTAGWWMIPGADTKNGEPHRVPLVREVVALIRGQQGPDGRDTDDREPNEFVFVGAGLSVRDRAKKAPSAVAKALGIDFRGHDLRRTAATRMAEAGIPRDHISHVLNHVDGGSRATRVYDRHTYDNEKRRALETWAHRLRAILKRPRRKAHQVAASRSAQLPRGRQKQRRERTSAAT